MQSDFRRADVPTELHTDLCIIGAGAAGITLASEVATSGLKVILVESGGADPDPGTAALSEGEVVGFPFTGLTEGRVRAFGGATRRWFGQCIRLDPIDFEQRDWVSNSGWPIPERTLAPFYDRAESFLELDRPIYDGRIWSEFRVPVPAFRPEEVVPKFTIFCRQPDFKKAHFRRLTRTADIHVLLNATAVRLRSNEAGSSVEALEIRSLNGRSGVIAAKAFVLCGGGVENPRMLLASNDVVSPGLGNARDLVGRYLQDHPSGRTALVIASDPRTIQEQFGILQKSGLRYWPKLALSAAKQRRDGLLNANGYPVYDYAEASDAGRLKRVFAGAKTRDPRAISPADIAGIVQAGPRLAREAVRWLSTGRSPAFPPSRVWIQAFTEQAPDAQNRVELGEDRDRFGVPQARIRWRLSDQERRTLLAMTEAVADEFRRLDFGDARIEAWLKDDPDALAGRVNDAFHHAGTTRMAADPSRGVVDTDCRVHGIANLYVAGGSVLPTSGYANPTLTIVALAIRLADQLKAALDSGMRGQPSREALAS